jgi:transposase
LRAGVTASDVARQVGVTRQTVYNWKTAFARGVDFKTFLQINRGGRPARLDASGKEWLAKAVCSRPANYRFPGKRWSLKLVQRLLEGQFGVDLSISQVSRLLRDLDLPMRDTTMKHRSRTRSRS